VAFESPVDYDIFMGRYSRQLAPLFAGFAGVGAAMRVLDVGSGPGALAQELAAIVGGERLATVDPSASFVQVCSERVPEADVRQASAEELPWQDDIFDVALAQLVLHVMSHPESAVSEMLRVVKPDGIVAACTWDSEGAMRMLSAFWDAALALDPSAPAQGARTRLGEPDALRQLWESFDISDVVTSPLDTEAHYRDFDDLWFGFTLGVGPSGSYYASLEPSVQDALRRKCFEQLGAPRGQLTLSARAWAVKGTKRA
jgi:ubiquinone/menaquinone biosynthesis C-methylase UbiE